jgi:hypothetical protein
MIFSILGTSSGGKGKYTAPNNSGAGAYNTAASIADKTAIVMPVPGTFDIITAQGDVVTSAPGETFTLYINGSPTALSVTVPSGQLQSTLSNTPIASAAGDLISVLYTSGSAGTFNDVAVSIRWIPNS